MMYARILLCMVIGIVAVAVSAQEVYRWVDEDGTVHFADRPQEGQGEAETVVLPKAQTFSAPASPAPRKSSAAATKGPDPASAFSYVELTILKPGPQESLWSTGGELEVNVSLNPELQPGHSVLIYLDDQMVDGKADGDLTFKLTEVYRGTHALHAEVRDGSGKRLIKSSAIEFTVHQTSTQNPNNPNNIPGPGG